jgi:glycosyltransferase involved in cell wall biosynthesis
MLDWLPAHQRRPKFRWIAYLPIDGGPFYPPWKSILSDADLLVAMSEFGRGVLAAGLPTRQIECARHGVDLDRFHPLSDREHLKQNPRLRGKFVVVCVARNQARKNLPTLVKAFALLVRKGLPVHLLLHTNPCDVGFDLVTLFQRYGLEGHADISPPTFSVDSPWEDSTLNQVYNLADAMVLPSVGEGFGLPLLEAMAAGVPVVTGEHSACCELVRGHGELSRVLTTVTTGANLIEYPVLDVEDLAARIEKLYRDPGLRQEYSAAGVAFAKGLSWDRLIPQWLNLIGSTAGVDLAE